MEEGSKGTTEGRTYIFRKLSSRGHDEYEKAGEEIAKEFSALLAGGYALFVDELQVRSLEEAERQWSALFPTQLKAYVTAVPALRGGVFETVFEIG